MTFRSLDRYVTERLARFISKKHRHSGRAFGLKVLIDRGLDRGVIDLGLVRLSGSVRNGAVNAVR
ncbi:MAG: hypothetical protein LC808_28330 [Actinobacteria bacterium]|nr:hypothetical protein [Actinomycetota bacterium]